uniref:ER membrane protein complex subunit 3 n=1 Tax=Aureoumbra lagunensis TaxID=44058 RepID=A0A7S3NPS9_9STRA|mmetsp:Transcript_799/g.1018  ORF Transcript_799/g.1018 Transcript_799/m.1018 type:complete len:295 (-) Transcript_799:95-979(-)
MLSQTEALLLDPAIRDWVVLPMVVLMVLMGLARHYAQQLLKSSQSLDAMEIQHKQRLMRSARLRARGKFIPASSFNLRKAYFIAKDSGILQKKVKKTAINPMANPMGMMDGMKSQALYMVPNMVMMSVISYFFHGFVLVKIPFPLTNRFKVMLQRGVDLATLDVSYVSSLSWYFLVLFGLRGLFKILLGEDSDALDEARATQMSMGMMHSVGGAHGPFDAPAAYKHERQELQMAQHTWLLEDAETKLLGNARLPITNRGASKTLAKSGTTSSSSKLSSKQQTRVKKIRKKSKAA